MKLLTFFSTFLILLVCHCNSATADELEAIILHETRTFSYFSQRGEVYHNGAFICFVEFRGIDAGLGGLDDSSSTVSAISGHSMESHILKVTEDGSGMQRLAVLAADQLDADLLINPVVLDNAKNGIFFHCGNEGSLVEANARIAQIVGSGKSATLVTSSWLPQEVQRLTGYERPGADGVSPQSVFSPGISNSTNSFSWTCSAGTDNIILVKAVESHRARIEFVLQSLDAENRPIDADQGFVMRFGTATPSVTAFTTPKGTSRIHRFLVNPERIDSLPFPVGATSLTPVWTLAPTLAGGTAKAVIRSVSVDLFRALPIQVWNHKGVEKKLTVLSPTTLNPEKGKSLRVQWRATGFSEDDKILISGALDGATGPPVKLVEARPYQGFEDGLNGMIMLEPSRVLSIGAQPATIKLFFDLDLKTTTATPTP
jgi:hypothetical protein